MLQSSCGSRSDSPLPVLRWDRLWGPSMRYSCSIVTLCVFLCSYESVILSCDKPHVFVLVHMRLCVCACFTSPSHEQESNWRCRFPSCSWLSFTRPPRIVLTTPRSFSYTTVHTSRIHNQQLCISCDVCCVFVVSFRKLLKKFNLTAPSDMRDLGLLPFGAPSCPLIRWY